MSSPSPAFRRIAFCGLALASTLATASAQAWQQVVPAAQPIGLSSPGMAWDEVRQSILLFGGDSDQSPGGQVHDHTWSWNGVSWAELQPVTRPPARTFAPLAFDSLRHRIVMFGGFGVQAPGLSVSLADTWEWDGVDWQQRTPAHAPSGRGGFAMTYDAARGRTVLFGGGTGGSANFGDTWEWDGTDWTQRAPLHSPGVRARVSMVYDAVRGRCVLFGGNDVGFQLLGDTWEWDGVDWQQRITPHAPSPRFSHGLTYDAGRARVVLHGGAAPWSVGDTWEFDGHDWQLVQAVTRPSDRAYPGMAFDPLRGRVVLFGGNRIQETWEFGIGATTASYTAFGQGCLGSAGTPSLAVASGRPLLGTTMTLTGNHLPPAQLTVLLFGLSRTAWNGVALPLDLGAMGMPGCTLYVSGDALLSLLNWGGQAAWAITVPLSPSLRGLRFFNQVAVLDTQNAFGMVASNAGTGLVGDL